MSRIAIDNAACERWVERGNLGDSAACRELVEYLWPIWVEMVRSSRAIQLLANAEDGVHDVVVVLVEKLGQPSGRGLRLYGPWREQNPGKNFDDWLRIVTKNAIRDYLREKGVVSRSTSPEAGVKRLLNEFASAPALDQLGARPAMTLAQTARELLEFARTRLSAEQFEVLEAWLKGASFEEIAQGRGLDEEVARQVQRSSVAVLRRHFGAAGDDD